jgi:hypothetical protein
MVLGQQHETTKLTLLHNETDQDIKQSEDIRPARKIKGKK